MTTKIQVVFYSMYGHMKLKQLTEKGEDHGQAV